MLTDVPTIECTPPGCSSLSALDVPCAHGVSFSAQGFFNPYILRIMRQLLGVEGLVLGRQPGAQEEMNTRSEQGGEMGQEGARNTHASFAPESGGRARLRGAFPIQIRVPRVFWAHCTEKKITADYGALLEFLLTKHDCLPIGLYRGRNAISRTSRLRFETSRTTSNHRHEYVVTNPMRTLRINQQVQTERS